MSNPNKETLRIVIGSDEAAYEYKEHLKADLLKDPRVSEIIDVGVEAHQKVAYPNIARKGSELIVSGSADRGIFLCGTGLGMAISANKVPGVRAVTAHDSYSVERSIKSNNAQVLCMGQRVIGLELARRLVSEWLDYQWNPQSPSAQKVEAIMNIEADSHKVNNKNEEK